MSSRLANTSINKHQGNQSSTNLFLRRKSIVQGMLDLALLSSNVNHLRYIIDYKVRNFYYYDSLTLYFIFYLVLSSLFFQILVGCVVIFKFHYTIYFKKKRSKNFQMSFVFFSTVKHSLHRLWFNCTT